MDSFSEPYTRLGDDISLSEVRAQVRELEAQHRANGIPLSGRVIHVCHYLPITSTLSNRAGVLSPPATPPNKAGDVPPSPTGLTEPMSPTAQLLSGSTLEDKFSLDESTTAPANSISTTAWTLGPRYGHAAMISGIRSLSATHEQLIVGWTGDIHSPTPGKSLSPSLLLFHYFLTSRIPCDLGEFLPTDSISADDKASLDEALAAYAPIESGGPVPFSADPASPVPGDAEDRDQGKGTTYVPVWLDDKVAHGHYDGYCKQSKRLTCFHLVFLT